MPKHILTVDDESAVRELIGEALTMAGFRVTCVANAQEAVQVVREDCPNLIVTDLQLEETDGFDLIERVKAIAPNVPVILLTGILFDDQVVHGPGWENIAAYIEKTSSLEQIVQTVKKHAG